MLNADCIYSTWKKIQMRRNSFFFSPYDRQDWKRDYKAARAIFGSYPLSLPSQNTIKLIHKALYGRPLKHNENDQLSTADDLWKLVFLDRKTQRIEPCIYNYIVDDNTWRFSQTSVRYAGEFHPRPKYGWDDEWELVFDNGSGTPSPSHPQDGTFI